MRSARFRSWALLCPLLAGLACAGQSLAGGLGISAAPCGTVPDSTGSSVTTSITNIPFHYYKVPVTRGAHANRDIEFLWSDTYLSRFGLRLDVETGTEQLTDLDRLGQAACESENNPLGLPWTDMRVMYNYLAMQVTLKDSVGQPFQRPSEYDADENHPIGSRVAQGNYPDVERNHLAATLPARFALLANRPNPFGDGTTSRFDTPRAAHVRLEVFDAQGRRVRTLADRAFEPGEHALTWDGTDSGGRRLWPGVYLYRMTAEGFREQRRMVLLGR